MEVLATNREWKGTNEETRLITAWFPRKRRIRIFSIAFNVGTLSKALRDPTIQIDVAFDRLKRSSHGI